MANPTCRNCDRSADAGAYCSTCAAGIMAIALDPHFRGSRMPIGMVTSEAKNNTAAAQRRPSVWPFALGDKESEFTDRWRN